jgi:hypothetical protein
MGVSVCVCMCVHLCMSYIGMPKVCLVHLLVFFLYLQAVHMFQSRRAIFLNNVNAVENFYIQTPLLIK